MAGYIKLFRGWDEACVFKDEPRSEREAWLWLIENAAWKSGTRLVGKGTVVNVARGQIHLAERTLARIWGWDRKRVARFIKRLENAQMITPHTGPLGTLITICNYDKFQGEGATNGATKGATNGATKGATQEEREEGKKENKKTNKENFDLSAWSERLPPDLWGDFKKHRAAKRAPITATALKGIEREAAKAGISFERAIRILLERGWTGFKAEWHNGEGAKRSFKQR